VPKQNSSGGKDKLGSISKQGDRYLRSLFTTGALAVIRYAKLHGTKHRPWLAALLARRPTKVAAALRTWSASPSTKAEIQESTHAQVLALLGAALARLCLCPQIAVARI
jgi:transposase